MQQDDIESCIESAVARVRAMAQAWEPILARSVWYQAVGSLAESISQKIITDIMDMSSIGQDEAYSVAQVIAKVTELDDLFLPSRLHGKAPDAGDFASTPQYASSWLRLKYLSEVLQSNLNEVRYLWFDSELSLYFSPDEVVDLIKLSFEDNARSREVVKEILQKPRPVHT
jgi:protein transport protein DSL1/ZW10